MINVSNAAPQSTPPVSTVPPQQPPAPTTPTAPESASPAPGQPEMIGKKKNTKMFLIGGIVLAIVAIGGLASLFLVQEPQDLRQQASQCKEECPTLKDGILRSCTPPDGDGTSNDSICNAKGRVESCGGVDYCCPAPNGIWSTNMEPCATPTPEPECEEDVDCEEGEVCLIEDDEPAECVPAPTATPEPTIEPTVEPTLEPTVEPTIAPTSEPNPTAEPTSSGSSSSSSSTSTVTVNIDPTQPPLPSELPQTGPEDWLKYLSAGLGAIGAGAILFLFL